MNDKDIRKLKEFKKTLEDKLMPDDIVVSDKDDLHAIIENAADEQTEIAAITELDIQTGSNEFKRYLLKDHNNTDKYIINPYAFFPIESIDPDRKVFEKEHHSSYTGYLQCKLEILEGSGVFIPNTTKVFKTTKKDEEHRIYDFFSYKNLIGNDSIPSEKPVPVIPGSSIRGMARSVYEQITNSCFSIIDEDNMLYKRTNLPKIPYIMKYNHKEGKWVLYEEPKIYKLGRVNHPDDYILRDASGKIVNDRIQPGGDNWIKQSPSKYTNDYYKRYKVLNHEELKIGSETILYATDVQIIGSSTPSKLSEVAMLHVTGELTYVEKDKNKNEIQKDKKHLTLFLLDSTTEKKWENDQQMDEALSRFELVIENYCKPFTQANSERAASFYNIYRDRYNKKQTILVYADEDLRYMSPACMTKEYFTSTINELLKKQHKHNHCEGSNLCPACRLFGIAGKNVIKAFGSRVRFADATYNGSVDDIAGKDFPICTLPPMMSPNVTSTEFILKRPNSKAINWNYDYYTKNNVLEPKNKDVVMYPGQIIGRKVYWNYKYNFEKYSNEPQTRLNNTVRLLRKGAFDFKVYFEDISSKELDELIFAIGGKNGKQRLQKLGRGKGVGLGSVKVGVNSITIKSYTKCTDKAGNPTVKTSISNEFPQPPLLSPLEQARRRLVEHYAKNLSDYDNEGKNYSDLVEYPDFNWFKSNRGTPTNELIIETLRCRSVDDEFMYLCMQFIHQVC
ncbi:MAG: TIGR03986 family CRISPR-associated RAMP protein [Coriobacteriia bacterium]|nr:TIGR03986 family CRISPR-associated RAMP protein [Coriobacteriia bacterium]